MAYAFAGNDNDKIQGQFSSAFGLPITIAMHLYIAAYPTDSEDCFLTMSAGTASQNDSLQIYTPNVSNTWLARAKSTAGANISATRAQDIVGAWTPVLATFSTSGGSITADIYVGARANTGTFTGANDAGASLPYLTIGTGANQSNDCTGWIAEVAVWNKVLSADEIDDFMASIYPTEIAAANLKGYYPLDTNNASQADESGNSGPTLTVSVATFDSTTYGHPTLTSGVTGGPLVLPQYDRMFRQNTLLRM